MTTRAVTAAAPPTPAVFALLLALTRGERHGYALLAEVAELTAGGIVLGPGTLYRSLQRMRVDGLVTEVAEPVAEPGADRRAARRRSYRITAAGRRAVRAEAHRLAALLASDAARAVLTETDDRPPGDGHEEDRDDAGGVPGDNPAPHGARH
ncbi:MAG TPA: PadR family transcriptional regulator [Pilimelia sp.]|nr:PadR family transcriptional regulator [Pilimelia sp.]